MRTIKFMLVSVFTLTFMIGCGGEKKKEEGNKKITLQKESSKVKVEEAVVVLTDEEVSPLLTKNTCVACHKKSEKLVGPSFSEIAKRNYTNQRIVELIYKPEPKNWPNYPPMVGLSFVPKGEALKIAGWINSLK